MYIGHIQQFIQCLSWLDGQEVDIGYPGCRLYQARFTRAFTADDEMDVGFINQQFTPSILLPYLLLPMRLRIQDDAVGGREVNCSGGLSVDRMDGGGITRFGRITDLFSATLFFQFLQHRFRNGRKYAKFAVIPRLPRRLASFSTHALRRINPRFRAASNSKSCICSQLRLRSRGAE